MNHSESSATSVVGRSSYPYSRASSITVAARRPPSRWSCSSTLGAERIVSRVIGVGMARRYPTHVSPILRGSTSLARINFRRRVTPGTQVTNFIRVVEVDPRHGPGSAADDVQDQRAVAHPGGFTDVER